MLASGDGYQPPDAPLSRGLEVHPGGAGEDLEIWIDRRYVPAGYGWSFPARDELRIGIGSFDPRFHVRDTTVLLTEDLGKAPNEYQGNWIPHKLRRATEGGVFFTGDSAGHCLPLTAEGIRTAFYFGIALGRELRAVVDGESTRERAAESYARFNDSHERKFRWMLRAQRLLPRIPARVQRFLIRLCGSKRFVDWSFGHYLAIAPPDVDRPLTERPAPRRWRARDRPRAGRGRLTRRSEDVSGPSFTLDLMAHPATSGGTAPRPLSGRRDVLICGASFAGLAAARELAGSGADVLVLDRYEIGHRPTSACAIPTDWLRALGMMELELQRFGELVVHTNGGRTVLDLPYAFSTFDYDAMCLMLWRNCDASFEVATVAGRGPGRDGEIEVETDRGTVSAPLVVDALGWRRLLAAGPHFQPVGAPLTRALEVHPAAGGEELEVWLDRRYVRAGYGWSFPAGRETRVGACSWDPRGHVRTGTDALAEDLGRERARYQGNWIPHKLRPPVEADVFFAGDSAGHCYPMTAEGIRPALYYGIGLGRLLRDVNAGRRNREQAMAEYSRMHDSHRRGFGILLFFQRLIPWIPPWLLTPLFKVYRTRFLIDLTFNAYMQLAPPEFAESRSADDEDRSGEQKSDSDHPLRRERDLVEAEKA